MSTGRHRLFYFLVGDWTWWAWTATAILLTLGLLGHPGGYLAAMAVTAGQIIAMVIRERSLLAFPVQLRLAYFLLLIACFIPGMRWLYWLPTVGTFALVIFGYCLMARCLSLLPWNRREFLSADLLRRTFLSSPDLSRSEQDPDAASCAGGLCTIEAQVAPASSIASPGTASPPAPPHQ